MSNENNIELIANRLTDINDSLKALNDLNSKLDTLISILENWGD